MLQKVDVSRNFCDGQCNLKYYTPHPLSKLVKMDVSERFYDEERNYFFERNKGCKVPCVKIIC